MQCPRCGADNADNAAACAACRQDLSDINLTAARAAIDSTVASTGSGRSSHSRPGRVMMEGSDPGER
jgi:uncharacterized membrane protein YvbJ